MMNKETFKTTQRVTMQQIADYCGVSKGAVSLALRESPHVSEETRARILTAIKELGYNATAHDAARRLSLMRNNTHVLNHVIALFFVPDFCEFHDGFLSRLFHGIFDGVRKENYRMLLDYLTNGPDDSPMVPLFERNDVDGTILFGRSWDTRDKVARLRGTAGFRTRPIVTFLPETDIPESSLVNSDDYAGMYTAITHLLDLGHRHFLYTIHLNSIANPEPPARYAGICQALRDAGLDPMRHLTLMEMEPEWLEPKGLPAGYRRVNATPVPNDNNAKNLLSILRTQPKITAIMALNDPMAFRIWQVLYNAGISVPQDISLIGFDDTETVVDDKGTNQLTTVRVPLYQIGAEAARLVIELAQDETLEPRKVILPTELIVRASTAPARPRQ